jgi:hypothetical protein
MSKTDTYAALIAAVEAGGHSVFAPSAAHRWFVCPASLRASLSAQADLIDEDGSPVTGSNYYSVEGTAAHDVAQDWLNRGVRPDARVGETFERDGIAVEIDEEMLDFVGQYVDAVMEDDHTILFVETRVDMSDLFPLPNQGGTADAILYDRRTGTLHIKDLKYGKGVRVFATENHQLMLYAYGAIKYLRETYPGVEVRRIFVHIIQPRLEHFDSWEVDPLRLSHFAWEVKQRAAQAWSDDAPYNPDPKACRFCPVRSGCRALAEQAQHMADAVFADDPPEDQDPPCNAGALTLAEKAAILRWRPTIESWFNRLYEDALRAAEGGDEVPGWKIGEGRRQYRWRNPDTVADALDMLGLPEDEIYDEPSVRSPAQVKKVLRKHGLKGPQTIAGLIEVTSGKRTLVPLIDPRKGLAGLADVFREEDGDDDLL